METKLPDSENGIPKNRTRDHEKQCKLCNQKLVKKYTADYFVEMQVTQTNNLVITVAFNFIRM